MNARVGIALFFAAMLGLRGISQGQQSTKPRAVLLKEVLSCADDPFMARVFDLTNEDADKLMMPDKADPKLVESYGFWLLLSHTVGHVNFTVMPTHQNNSFCRSYPNVGGFAVPKNDTAYHPVIITFDCGDAWTLDPNEVFAHADQFKFESGIFKNSTDVYMLATRGDTTIQFIFDQKSKRLKLSRVFYDNPKGFE
jgi:hypothetical protein